MNLLFRDVEVVNLINPNCLKAVGWNARVQSVWDYGTLKIRVQVWLRTHMRLLVVDVMEEECKTWCEIYNLVTVLTEDRRVYDNTRPPTIEDFGQAEELGKQRAIMILDGA